VVAPGFHDGPFQVAMPMRYFASRRAASTTVELVAAEARERTTDRAEEGAPPGSSVVPLAPATGRANVADGAPAAALPILGTGGGGAAVQLLVEPGRRIAICAQRDAGTAIAALREGEWSPFYRRALGRTEAAMRFRLLAADPQTGTVDLVRSEAYATRDF